MTRVEYLEQALDLIETPERWTTKAPARRDNGTECNPKSESAVSWCAAGAIACVAPDAIDYDEEEMFQAEDDGRDVFDETNEYWRATDLIDSVAVKNHEMSIVKINDRLGHAAVIEVFRKAIERGKKESDAGR